MDNVDRFIIEFASAQIKQFVEPKGDDYYFDSDEHKYVDPLAFEAYIRNIPAQLWAPEFRNAYATIRGYIPRNNTDKDCNDLIDALTASKESFTLLSKIYCPQILEELEAQQPVTNIPEPVTNRVTNEVTKCTNDPRPELPAGIKETPGARAAFDSLITAGYLDSEYKPTASASKNVVCAYMAATLSQLLGVDHWAKVFADFWRVKPILSQSYNQLNPGGKQFTADIDKALAAAARNCEQLAQTKKGKELIGKKS